MNTSDIARARAPTATFPRQCTSAAVPPKAAKDGEDRERRQDEAVGEPVQRAAPEDRGGETEAVRVVRGRLLEDDRRHHADEEDAESDAGRQLCVSTARADAFA